MADKHFPTDLTNETPADAHSVLADNGSTAYALLLSALKSYVLQGVQLSTITDEGGYYTTDTVEGALQEIGAEISGIDALIGSGVIS